VEDEHDEDGKHGIEDALVVSLLDPGVDLEEVEERVPSSHDVALEKESLFQL